MTAAVIFLVAGFVLLHTYALYPLVLRLMRKPFKEPLLISDKSRRATQEASKTWPSVSVIIPFHNEEQWASRKLENILSCDYPTDKLEVIAVSDGSVDTTNAILDRYKDRIHAIAYHPRRGKATALNAGVAQARGA